MIDTPGRALGWAVTAYDFVLIVLFHLLSLLKFFLTKNYDFFP